MRLVSIAPEVLVTRLIYLEIEGYSLGIMSDLENFVDLFFCNVEII